jgi:hypothetical protein
MSGRGMGTCAGYDMPGYAHGYARWGGYGMRPFGRHGYRHWFHATGQPGWMRTGAYPYPAPPPPSPEQEQQMLKDEEAWLQEQLDAVHSRMKEKTKE